MPLTKAKKAEILSKISGILKDSASVVFVNFHGLPVAVSGIMRKAMRAQEVGFTVAKKSLIKRALGEKTINGTMPVLNGELALAYGTDAVAPAKQVADFAKKNEGKISIIGGIFEGAYMSALEMKTLAATPSRDTLLGMLANVWSAPARSLVIALDQISRQNSANV